MTDAKKDARDQAEHEHHIVREFKRLVRNYISGADTETKIYRATLESIQDKAMEDGKCRWCGGEAHTYTCPAAMAASALAMSHEPFPDPDEVAPLPPYMQSRGRWP